MRAESADLEGLDGELEVVDGASGRSEMEHVVDGAGDVDVIGDVGAEAAEARMLEEMADVGVVAGDEVVERKHVPAFGDEAIAKMRAEKAGASGDHRAHGASLEKCRKSVACGARHGPVGEGVGGG